MNLDHQLCIVSAFKLYTEDWICVQGPESSLFLTASIAFRQHFTFLSSIPFSILYLTFLVFLFSVGCC